MSLDFKGRTALLVGGAGPLCGALADRLSERGAAVFGARGAAAGDPEPEIAAQTALAAAGRIDILVLGAETGPGEGRPARRAQPIGAFDLACLDRAGRALDVVIPAMRSAGYGRVLSIAPAGGAFGSAGDPAGAALAGAFYALAKSVAAGHPDGAICANILSPLVAASMSGDLFDAVPTLDRSCFGLEGPLAMALHLCHEACVQTGESFSVGGGRFARIFQATAAGLFDPALSDDQVGAALPAIADTRGYIVPRCAADEIVLVAV